MMILLFAGLSWGADAVADAVVEPQWPPLPFELVPPVDLELSQLSAMTAHIARIGLADSMVARVPAGTISWSSVGCDSACGASYFSRLYPGLTNISHESFDSPVGPCERWIGDGKLPTYRKSATVWVTMLRPPSGGTLVMDIVVPLRTRDRWVLQLEQMVASVRLKAP